MSITCPWNDQNISNIRGGYPEKYLRASLPVYQRGTTIPDSCANTNSSYYHLPLDQTSFQFGRSVIYQNLTFYTRKNVSTNSNYQTFLNYQSSQFFENTSSIKRYLWDHSIPNPPNNITRLFYDQNNSGLTTGIPYFGNDSIGSFQNGDLGTRLAMKDRTQSARIKENTSFSQFGFPFEIPLLNANQMAYYGGNFSEDKRGRLDPVYFVDQLEDGSLLDDEWGAISYFHLMNSGQACSASIPINANALAVGCDHYGCEFGLTVSTCSSQSVKLQDFGNKFYSPRISEGNSMTGCGVVRVDLVKTKFDPWFRQICCRRAWPDFLQYSNSSSLTVRTSMVYGLSTYSSGPPVVPSLYTAEAVYCDPSWVAGNAACDLELGAFCGTQQSYSNRLGATVSVALAEGHPCNAWYNGIMLSYTQANISQRNIDIVEDLVQRYCLKYPNDSISCQCVGGFASNGYYTVDTGRTYSLIAVDSQTQNFYTDALCSSVPCTNNLNSFELRDGGTGASTLVPPSVIQAKRHCPLGICYVINNGSDITGTNITSLRSINIANLSQFCTVSANVIRTLSVNYDVIVSGYDNISGIVGRYFYTAEGFMTPDNGIARVQVRVSVSSNLNNQVILNSTVSGNSSLFQFATPRTISNPSFALTAPTYNLTLEPVPGANLRVTAANSTGFILNTFTATLTTQINGSPQMTKIFPIRILLQPLSGPPTPSAKQIDLSTPSLSLPPPPQFSRTTYGVLILCGVLLFYSLAFIFEMVEIRNFQNKLRMNFSPPP